MGVVVSDDQEHSNLVCQSERQVLATGGSDRGATLRKQ